MLVKVCPEVWSGSSQLLASFFNSWPADPSPPALTPADSEHPTPSLVQLPERDLSYSHGSHKVGPWVVVLCNSWWHWHPRGWICPLLTVSYVPDLSISSIKRSVPCHSAFIYCLVCVPYSYFSEFSTLAQLCWAIKVGVSILLSKGRMKKAGDSGQRQGLKSGIPKICSSRDLPSLTCKLTIYKVPSHS